jgi:hypothetical protein
MSSDHAANDDTACFAVRAQPDAGSLPRILELFAKRGLVPSRVMAVLCGEGEETRLLVELEIGGLAPMLADIIAESLRQIVVVERVLTARGAMAALQAA